MNRRSVIALVIVATAAAATTAARAHCQIPCGIYDDDARFTEMLEHVTTIEKSMNEITRIGSTDKPDWNQLVRWVTNKDDHADRLTEVVTYYFMAQRIKPPQDGASDEARSKYARELSLLHRIMVHAMKAKQTTDLEHVAALRSLIEEFHDSYHAKPAAGKK